MRPAPSHLSAEELVKKYAGASSVDPTRIVLIGFSRGGQCALFASLKRFHKTWNKSGIDFAAYIPFYPDCMTTYQDDTEVVNRPIRVFHGEADDFNPLPPCRAYIKRLQTAQRNVTLTTYPNAAHFFDSPFLPTTPSVAKNAQTVRGCVLLEEPIGRIVNAETRQPFNYTDSCVQRDPHLGHDPSAAQAARQAVRAFLTTQLRLAAPASP